MSIIGIYCLSNLNEVLYIGSSRDIKHRYATHKYNYHNLIDRPIYNYLYENNINFNDLFFSTLKQCDLQELNKYEREFILLYEPIINSRLPKKPKQKKIEIKKT